jgi:hypothetical protein
VTDLLTLGSDVALLQIVVQPGADQSFGVQVVDTDGVTPVDVTGLTATIVLATGEEWEAVTSGSTFVWSLTAATTSAITWDNVKASMLVDDGTKKVCWARGHAERAVV